MPRGSGREGLASDSGRPVGRPAGHRKVGDSRPPNSGRTRHMAARVAARACRVSSPRSAAHQGTSAGSKPGEALKQIRSRHRRESEELTIGVNGDSTPSPGGITGR